MVNDSILLDQRSASRRLAALAESAADAIVSADSQGRITDWNPAAERIFGHRKSDVVGQSLELIMPERFRARHSRGLMLAASGRGGERLGATAELNALRRDGTEFPIELSLSTFEIDGQRYFTGVIRDISKRKATEGELRKVLGELERAHKLLADFMGGHLIDGRYRLEHKVASNDIGARYQATDLEQSIPVYVSLLRCARTSPSLSSTDIHARLAELPNTPEVFDVGIADVGLPFLVSEPLSGESLADRFLRKRGYSVGEAISWCAALAESLAVAHARGEVHGRLTPAAVFFQDADTPRERTLLLEYEVGPVAAAAPCLMLTRVANDPRFLAPELFEGERPSPASDSYALAALTAHLAVRAAGLALHASAILSALPHPLANLVIAGLSSDPRARPDCGALGESLRKACDGEVA